jgi:hypothetical protein
MDNEIVRGSSLWTPHIQCHTNEFAVAFERNAGLLERAAISALPDEVWMARKQATAAGEETGKCESRDFGAFDEPSPYFAQRNRISADDSFWNGTDLKWQSHPNLLQQSAGGFCW